SPAKMAPMKRGAFHLAAARAAGRMLIAAATGAAILFLSAPAIGSVAFASEIDGKRASGIWSPEILDGLDRETYRKLFAATERGNFREADKLTARLRDKRLLGHVLHIKYMGPHYRTSYAEL